MSRNEGGDVGFEFGRGSGDTALQLLAGQFGGPALDLIDPGSGCRGEVDMPMWTARRQALIFAVL